MKVDIEKLWDYHSRKLLTVKEHKDYPLLIWNYSLDVQYGRLWDDVTLMCRGLITDTDGNVIAKPFSKFFNVEEKMHNATDEFEIYEKMDGSLGIVFHYDNKWHVATRGSFESEQAIRAMEMLEQNIVADLDTSLTYCVEIIYPENRIVVDYLGKEFLSYLSSFRVSDGAEVYHPVFYEKALRYNFKDYTKIQSLNTKNQEGFVVVFSNGERCKIKFEDYLRLHKIVTETSSVHVWEMMKDGKELKSMLENVPDEFYDWVKSVINELESKFFDIKTKYTEYYNILRVCNYERSKFAEIAKNKEYPQLLFGLLDGKDIEPMIWKIIKPKKEKVFSV